MLFSKTFTMLPKPVSPKLHGLLDYGLVASLLTLPTVFGFSKKVKRLYAAEAAALLVYVALTDHPTAVKPLIPFRTHGKIDPFNIANFAAHSLLKPFREDRRAQIFNAVFTLLAGATVALTDWDGPTKRYQEGR